MHAHVTLPEVFSCDPEPHLTRQKACDEWADCNNFKESARPLDTWTIIHATDWNDMLTDFINLGERGMPPEAQTRDANNFNHVLKLLAKVRKMW